MNSQNVLINVLIIADKEDMKFLYCKSRSSQWNLIWKVIDYSKLYKEIEEIRDLIAGHDIDFILYSRNDQVAKSIRIGRVTKKLRIGYSSFSGIDEKDRIQQMKTCFEDFIECNKSLCFDIDIENGIEEATKSDARGTFSLIFDTEQMGGVRYGLPRIFKLLNKYDVRATFFVTNLMKKVYSTILDGIQSKGHEIGLHGRWHEYLSGHDKFIQERLVKSMITDLGDRIYGANLIGRMDGTTICVLIDSGVKYFVHPLIHYYKFLSYSKLPTNPFLISCENREIFMIPISVETYGRPWFSIKNMIDSAILESPKVNSHTTILLHPFRDGNMQHIRSTERLLRYLVITKRLKPLLVKDSFDKGYVKLDSINQIDSKLRLSRFLPRTKEDYIGVLPEIMMKIYGSIRGKNTIW